MYSKLHIVVNLVHYPTQSEPQQQTIAAKKLRPPSYTDRILIHSLPDRQDRVTVQAYDFCDRLRVSDHRAVSMTVRLEVSDFLFSASIRPVMLLSARIIINDNLSVFQSYCRTYLI